MPVWTIKQKEYWKEANHRWNIKSGATRSGKTYLDYFLIPKRIQERRGKDGLVILLGNTKGTLQRNVIEPMQNIWGTDLVGNIRADNKAYLFGEMAHCLGADKINQVNRLRGASVKYCYGDEVVTWHPEVFEMLKSRMDKDYSLFDGTCNPEGPRHWVKEFLDSDADIYSQHYTIYDNDFLSKEVVKSLEQEYNGTVFFDRYILGKWTLAEGLIYQTFADKETDFYIDRKELPRLIDVTVGVDFGGNKSNHAFVATAFSRDLRDIYVLLSESIPATGVTVNGIINRFNMFCDVVESEYGPVNYVFADSAEQAIINTMRSGTKYGIRNSIKNPILDRIRCENVLINTNRLHIVAGCNDALANGLKEARWNDKKMDDERLDDGTSDIDVMDAFEYSWEYRIKNLLRG